MHVSNNAKLDQNSNLNTVMGDISNKEVSLSINGDYTLTNVSPVQAFTTGGSAITLTFKSAFPSSGPLKCR